MKGCVVKKVYFSQALTQELWDASRKLHVHREGGSLTYTDVNGIIRIRETFNWTVGYAKGGRIRQFKVINVCPNM